MTPPENILRRMTPAARAKLGHQTAEEAMAAYCARSERELHNQISNLLSLRGVRWNCHSRTDRRTTQAKGVPDFLFVYKSLPMAWEVKYGRGKLRPEQESARIAMIEDGWCWSLITTLKEAMDCLEWINQTHPANGK